jgi:hypothetical protein
MITRFDRGQEHRDQTNRLSRQCLPVAKRQALSAPSVLFDDRYNRDTQEYLRTIDIRIETALLVPLQVRRQSRRAAALRTEQEAQERASDDEFGPANPASK